MKSNELSRTDLKAITSYKDKWLKALCESGIKPGYISTALAFSFYINTDVTHTGFGLAWPTYPQLQKYSNVGNDTTKTNINDMIEDGWLVVEGMHNSGHRTISLAMGTSNVMLKPQKAVSKKSKDNLRQFTLGAYEPKYPTPVTSPVPIDSALSTDSSGVPVPIDSALSTDSSGLKRTIEEIYRKEIDNRTTANAGEASLTSIKNISFNKEKNNEEESLISIKDSFTDEEEIITPVPKLSVLKEYKTEPVTCARVEKRTSVASVATPYEAFDW